MSPKSSRKPDRWYYFAYGSNMCLKQMAERCPSSLFMGKGKVDGYRWQINQRGVANIVQCKGEYVEGLIYQIGAKDKRQLDRNEGVALGFYDEDYPYTLFSPMPHRGIKTFRVAKELDMSDQLDPKKSEHKPFASGLRKSNVQESNSADKIASPRLSSTVARQENLEMVKALVYVSSEYKEDGFIRTEYIKRMEKAIADGRKMGLSSRFLNHIDRIIHQQLPPRLERNIIRARDNPQETLRGTGASHRSYEHMGDTGGRRDRHERVLTVQPSYARYIRIITIRPK